MATKQSTSNIGKLLDQLWSKKEQLAKHQAVGKKLKKEFDDLEAKVFNTFKKSDIEGATGSKCKASISSKDVPTIKDWKSFMNFVIRNRATELLQHRISAESWRERMEAGKKVPGVEPYTVIKLHLTKKRK